MNLRQLRSLAAFLEQGSFAAAGDRVGLSQSAISIQMRQLEDELGVQLFDRSHRPPVFTDVGEQVAKLGRSVLAQIDDIRAVATGQGVARTVSMGFVPTTLQTLAPVVLNRLRALYPQLQVNVKSGLSGELATMVSRRELDFAILTAPVMNMPDLEVSEIAREPLFVIAPSNRSGITDDGALARSGPFISFSKRSWLGQNIALLLQARGIYVDEVMEIDSIDAIEALVADGFGVSIVPRRLLAHAPSRKLVEIPFGTPAATRSLVLIQPVNGRRTELETAIKNIVTVLPTLRPARS